MTRIQISGTGLFTPKEVLTNDELVDSYNKFVEEFNLENKGKIKSGEVEELQTYADRYESVSNLSLSGSDFINVGKHETAEELLRLIREWEVNDE